MINSKLRSIEKWYRGKWKTERLTKDDLGYNAIQNYSLGDEFKYRLVNLESVSEDFYDPFHDAPKAYLSFTHLTNNKEDAPEQVIKKVLKFTNEYGPLWDMVFPLLTIENILFHAEKLASAVNMYKALMDYENGNRPINDVVNNLKEKLRLYYETSWAGNNMVQNTEGLIYTSSTPKEFEGKITPISLRTDEQIITAAKAYIIECVNEGLTVNNVIFNLSYQNITDTNPHAEGWVPTYEFINLLSVLWLEFYVDILNKSRLYDCANPKCKIIFVPKRSDEKFHSPECRNRYHSLKSQKARNKGGIK